MTTYSEDEDSVDVKKDIAKVEASFSRLSAAARRDTLVQKHTDKQGNVDMEGVATEVAFTRKNYKMLVKALVVSVLLLFLLVLSTFGVSLAAAILAKDTQVDYNSGALMVKNGSDDNTVVKTQEALVDVEDPSIADMSFQELQKMKQILVYGDNGNTGVQFDVKGVSKTAGGRVALLVEGGGTIVYDATGIVNATGIAKTFFEMLEMDSQDTVDDDNSRRWLGGGRGYGRSSHGHGSTARGTWP